MRLSALLNARWLVAFMVLPYALLWGRAADSGGALMAFMVTALLLFYFAALDEIHVNRLDETRLGFVRQRGRVDPEAAVITKYIFGGIAKILAIVLLFVEFWVGIAGLVAMTIIWVCSLRTRRWPVKTLWAEVLVPLVALVLPLILVDIFAEWAVEGAGEAALAHAERLALLGALDGLVSPAVHLATLVGAAMLAGFLLLCAIRDEPADRGTGVVTTATTLGRSGAGFAFFVLAAVATAIAIRGAGAIVVYGGFDPGASRLAWPWSIAAFVAVLSMLGVMLLSEREEQTAVGVWGAGAIATAVFLNISVF